MEQNSPLTRLPAELRNQIYQLALIKNDGPIDVTSMKQPNEPGLLATCKQIRTEALPIFYSNNAFVFVIMTTGDDDKSILYLPSRWLETLGKARCALIEDFRIELSIEPNLDYTFQPESSGETVLQGVRKESEGARDRQTKGVVKCHVAALQKSGMRLHAVKFMAPDRLKSSADVVKKLFQEAGELVLSEYAAFEGPKRHELSD